MTFGNHLALYIYSFLSEVPSYLILPLFHTDTSQLTESVDDESSPPLNSISTVITAVTSGVAAFAYSVLLTAICFCVIVLRKRTLKKESKGLQHRSANVSKQEEQGPCYEEIALQRPHYEEIPVQNYHIYHTLEPNA